VGVDAESKLTGTDNVCVCSRAAWKENRGRALDAMNSEDLVEHRGPPLDSKPLDQGNPRPGQQPSLRAALTPAPKKGILESWRGFAGLVTRSLRELFFMASENDSRLAEHRLPRAIWMLGVRYDLGPRQCDSDRAADESEQNNEMQEFRRDMQSRLWFTYRSNLAPITGNITSDSGWGCMLRSGQMMFAQALLVHNLGRNWRLPLDPAYRNLPDGYRQVLEWFEDQPSAPFSVHAIARAGEKVPHPPSESPVPSP